ncbi:MAG TPA: Sip1-related alpha-galactosidase, partial [Polyangiaceae bacterium]|nr:Sip1-related alpha-galactosidase [Polyangiaceae bacterium]
SVQRHFQGRLINCMSNAQETYYFSPDSTLIRTSIDFFPKLPESHGLHVYTNAEVGLWFGEFMHPDWDMFQSGHEWGAYHAAARAVSGGPIYVSDKPGVHDAAVLARLVCSDGSVLRCDLPGRPTLDVLFSDPTRDDVLFKVWNRVGDAGVVGVFNARVGSNAEPGPELSGETGPDDVPGLTAASFACFRYGSQTLERIAPGERRRVVLGERGYEIFTFVPIERDFAAIGLGGMLNASGAVRGVTWSDERTVTVALADGGVFVAYAGRRPVSALVAGVAIDFDYGEQSAALRVELPRRGRCDVTLQF